MSMPVLIAVLTVELRIWGYVGKYDGMQFAMLTYESLSVKCA